MFASIIEKTVSRAAAKPFAAARLRRGLATSSEASSSTAPSYPFSSSVGFRNPAPILNSAPITPSEIPSNLLNPKKGKSVVDHVNAELLEVYDPKKLCNTLFSRRHPTLRLLSGSVLSVVSYNNPTKTSTSVFSGVLMGIRRRGVDTSFRIRNILNKTGVEMNYKVYSPMIKEIQVIKHANGKQSSKHMRRAKLYILRDKPQQMAQIAGAVKDQGRR